MRSSFAPGALIAAIFLSAAILCSCEYDPLLQIIARRPERFGKDDQFANYIKGLQEYYGVTGRGRYGKRQMRAIMSDVYVRDDFPPPPLAPLHPFQQYHRKMQGYIQFH